MSKKPKPKPKPKADERSDLFPVEIDDETHKHIGRLIRAFAEIDDMVTLYICNLAEISESRAVILLGRTPISTKLKNALYLAKMTGEEITKLHKHVFDEAFYMANKCRNALAHGAFMGADKDGRLAFLTSDAIDPVDDAAVMTVMSFRPDTIKAYADSVVEALPRMEKVLKLESLRKKRRAGGLGAHPKGLKKLS